MDAQLITIVVLALAFAGTNGIHDASNAIAVIVATGAARPGPAVALAAAGNLAGPLLIGGAVADTVAGLVDVPSEQMAAVVAAALGAAVAWNLATWWLGLPSSSGHALVGGLAGAGIAAHGPGALAWEGSGHAAGLTAVVVALALSAPAGAAAAYGVNRVLRRVSRRLTTRMGAPVRSGQWVLSGLLAVGHGANDAQKSAGALGAGLVATGHSSQADWPAVACATALTAGTLLGGWRIARTVGRRIFPLDSLDGLACEGASCGVVVSASVLGLPTSTTQVVASSVVGAGGGRRRWHHVRWSLVRDMAFAWVVTVPAAAGLGATALLIGRAPG